MKTKKNNRSLKGFIVAFCSMTFVPATLAAQDKVEVSLGADIVSKYVWRGFDQGSGASIQPTLGLAYKGLSLSAWGSTSITDPEPKEIDISLGYNLGGFGITVTDYWWSGESKHYGYYKDDHYFEGALSYHFGEKFPLTISAATMFAGGDKNAESDQNFSTYLHATYDLTCPAGITLTPSIGVTTRSYLYTGDKKSGITDISLKASKDIRATDRFSIPVFAQFTVSPVMDKTYLVFGLSF
ncbi:TorF family putative porin [Bacteroides fragilis]